MVKNYPHEQGEMDVGKYSLRRASAFFWWKNNFIGGGVVEREVWIGKFGSFNICGCLFAEQIDGFFLGGMTLKWSNRSS